MTKLEEIRDILCRVCGTCIDIEPQYRKECDYIKEAEKGLADKGACFLVQENDVVWNVVSLKSMLEGESLPATGTKETVN